MVAAFTGVAIFATWPLAIHPLGGFYGFGNDNWGGMPFIAWLHHAYLYGGNASVDPQLQAPFGLAIPQYAIQPQDQLFALVFGGLGQGLGAYNAQIFLSFVLAGCTMYLLARYVTGSRLAALIAGFAFTFSPFHLAVAMQYNALASIQWIPLFLLALLVVLRRWRKRDAALAGAAYALVVAGSYYYAWFVAWFTLAVLVCLGVAVYVRRRRKGDLVAPVRPFVLLVLSRVAIAIAVAVVVAAPLLVTSVRSATQVSAASLGHPLNEAVRYSARPWMFFVPPEDNPIAGSHVEPFVQYHLFDSPVYEQSIYLGYTLLVLAVVAFLPVRRWASGLSEKTRFARATLLAGLVVALLITIGPYIPLVGGYTYWAHWETPGSTARLPSLPWLMFHLSSTFRFFVRAFVLVSACLAVLAAIGFSRIARARGMTTARSGALAVVVLLLIGFEFTNAPPHVWSSAQPPPWVKAVQKLPAHATVVQYPIAPVDSPRSLYYMFWDTKTDLDDTNPAATPDAQTLAATIAAPDDPATGKALHKAGVDYAIVHTRLPPQTTTPYQPPLPDDSEPRDAGALNPWFKLMAKTSDAVIYRIRSRPRPTQGTLVLAATGFGASEPDGNATARWLLQPTGELTLYVTGPRRRIAIVLTLSSFARSRQVSIALGGRRLSSFTVPPGGYVTRPVDAGPLKAGHYELSLSSKPGPQSIHETTGSPDTRSVSIRLREPIDVRSYP